MPYITATRRYSSPPHATQTQPFANTTKTHSLEKGASTSPSVNHCEQALSVQMQYGLPPRPLAPATYHYVGNGGGVGGQARWSQPGWHNGDQHQRAYSEYGYGQGLYQGWKHTDARRPQSGWQGTRQAFAPQTHQEPYGQRPMYQQGQHHGAGFYGSWQQPNFQHQQVSGSPSADQAWQDFYRQQYDSYSQKQSLIQSYWQQMQQNLQYGLTQSWQTAGDASNQAAATAPLPQLNANATAFQPQGPLK